MEVGIGLPRDQIPTTNLLLFTTRKQKKKSKGFYCQHYENNVKIWFSRSRIL